MQDLKEQLKDLQKSVKIALNSQGREKIIAYLYIFFSLLALSFFGFFAVRPTVTTITALQKQFKDSQKVLADLKVKNQALQTLTAQYQGLGSDLLLATNAIPDSPRIPELTRKLETLANQNNLVVTKLSVGVIELFPAKKKINSSIFSYTFSFSVQGSEAAINLLIADLINFDRIVGLERLTTGKAERNTFAASITGRAYFFKE